jgi:hypothetical protein
MALRNINIEANADVRLRKCGSRWHSSVLCGVSNGWQFLKLILSKKPPVKLLKRFSNITLSEVKVSLQRVEVIKIEKVFASMTDRALIAFLAARIKSRLSREEGKNDCFCT